MIVDLRHLENIHWHTDGILLLFKEEIKRPDARKGKILRHRKIDSRTTK